MSNRKLDDLNMFTGKIILDFGCTLVLDKHRPCCLQAKKYHYVLKTLFYNI